MFTGIVEELGAVLERAGERITVSCRTVLTDTDVGSSIAVNGVCLTVVDRGPGHLGFDLSE
ncbi:MAG TPA: riboflavin synthase, partial [Actinomycetota bacterium]|nr:riboflavin synthase [Actinomycetota bacterium]